MKEGGETTMEQVDVYDTETVPTYNVSLGNDAREAIPMSPSLAQYWDARQARLAQAIQDRELNLAQQSGEEEWSRFCASKMGFLQRFFKNAAGSLYWPLKDEWKPRFRDSEIVWNTEKNLKKDGRIECLFPISVSPAEFLRVPGRGSTPYDTVAFPELVDDRLEVGEPVVAVSWRDIDPLFLVLPSKGYIYFNTISYSKNGMTWNSGEVIPRVFAEKIQEYSAELEDARRAFACLQTLWKSNSDLINLRDTSIRLRRSSEAWAKIHLPERQKMEILRRAELFESNDPAAPRGLLLSGVPGTGKSLIGRTLGETMGCDFQKLSLADLKEEHLGASGKRVRAVWDRARAHRPAVIFLDECEGVLGRRGAAETDSIATEIVQSFLSEWDGVRGHARVWVVGATNRRDMLDDAILSRFGWEMELALPGPDERLQILSQEVWALGLTAEPPVEASTLTQGLSGRDLQQLARSARAIAYPATPSPEHFLEAIKAARKSRNTKVDGKASWDTLVLDTAVLDNLKLTCTLLRDAEKWKAQGVSIPKSLLLIGPPGVGKTEIGRTLANESGLTFLAATTADVKASFLGQSGNRVKQLFERARSTAPAILFLDELDIVAPDRSFGGGSDQLTDEIVGQLLQEMDGIRAYDNHVFLMAATNRFEQVDRAIRSRFSEKLVIPLPDRKSRIRLLVMFLTGKKLDFSLDDGAALLADLSEGKSWSGRDLGSWARSAEQRALMRALRDGGPEHYSIALGDFDEQFQSR
jgi:SpoVK/Ycf46/Vps4 family AAA+-type ATPase